MHRLVGFLLVMSISLYSAPLKADSYDSDPEMYADMANENADTSCPVRPESIEEQQPASPQEEYAEQDAAVEQNADDSTLTPAQDTYADQGNYTDHETMVTPESSQRSKRGRYKYWNNILLAVAVVAVAVTALLIVHTHEGHKSHH